MLVFINISWLEITYCCQFKNWYGF